MSAHDEKPAEQSGDLATQRVEPPVAALKTGSVALKLLLHLLLCVLLLAGCSASETYVEDSTPPPGAEALLSNPRASADDLYFEVIRLHGSGLISDSNLESLWDVLDEVEGRGDVPSEREELLRSTLASFLRRRLGELRTGERAGEVEAELEVRGYARQLNRAGVSEAQRYAERTLLIAGVLGVPTSKGEMALMIAAPVGGYIVVRVAGAAFKRAPLLLRHLRTADDVLDEARRRGWPPHYVATREEMKERFGDLMTTVGDVPPLHVGAGGIRGPGKFNPWNPSDRKDNCTACVASVVYNSLRGTFLRSADDMERLFAYAGRERGFDPEESLRYIEGATGLKANRNPVALRSGNAPVGHYAVFTRWRGGRYEHVVYGRVTPTGRIVIFDPQVNVRMSFEQMQKAYGPHAKPFLLEAVQ